MISAQPSTLARKAWAIAATLLFAIVLQACASIPSQPRANHGLEVASLRISAAGHLVDLRYRVTDPELAKATLGPKIKPRLTDEATGTVMMVPMTAKLGALRQTQATQKTGRTYFVLFANTAAIRPGMRVTAELGDAHFKHLVVE